VTAALMPTLDRLRRDGAALARQVALVRQAPDSTAAWPLRLKAGRIQQRIERGERQLQGWAAGFSEVRWPLAWPVIYATQDLQEECRLGLNASHKFDAAELLDRHSQAIETLAQEGW
jgi:hypothetical protein